MSILSKEAIAESEIILNKTNIALARSRKLIQSWSSAPQKDTDEDEDEDDFKPESETAGIGSTAGDKEDGSAVASLARSRKAANDKLLEQLLGKKAAQAHRKSQASTASKPLPVAPQQNGKPPDAAKVEDEDDDEGSRTSALEHSRARPKQGKAEVDDELPAKTSTKRKASSYLDELLSKKSRKKGRGTG